MSRRSRIVPALFAAALSLAGAAAQTDTARSDTVTPSRAVGRTHDCSGYYPDTARRLNQSGDVMIRYDVAADGTVSHVTLTRSSGHPELDEAAIVCVLQHWRNTPATRGRVAVASPNHQAIIRFFLHAEPRPDMPDAGTAESPIAMPTAAQAPAANPNALSPRTALLCGGFVLAVLLAAALRLILSHRVCPSCGASNRSPLLGPHYCSACGTKFAPRS